MHERRMQKRELGRWVESSTGQKRTTGVRAYGRVTDHAALGAGPGLLETLRRSCACAGRTQAGQRHMLPQGGASRSAGVVPTSYEPALRAAPHTGDMGSRRRYDEEAVQVSPPCTCPHAHISTCGAAPCSMLAMLRAPLHRDCFRTQLVLRMQLARILAPSQGRAAEKLPCNFGRQSGLLSSAARAAFRDHQGERERHAHSLRRFRAACRARSRDRPCQPAPRCGHRASSLAHSHAATRWNTLQKSGCTPRSRHRASDAD